MLPLLLNLQDFKDLLEIPEALELRRLRPYILEAQAAWLEDYLQPGYPTLYQALQEALSDELAALQARALAAAAGTLVLPALAPLQAPLLSVWARAKPMLVFASYANYLPFAPTTLTAHSFIEHTSDNSKSVDPALINKQVVAVTGWAQRHQAKLKEELQLQATLLAPYAALPSRCADNQNANLGTVAWLPIRNPRR
jgi:hypothetical protein